MNSRKLEIRTWPSKRHKETIYSAGRKASNEEKEVVEIKRANQSDRNQERWSRNHGIEQVGILAVKQANSTHTELPLLEIGNQTDHHGYTLTSNLKGKQQMHKTAPNWNQNASNPRTRGCNPRNAEEKNNNNIPIRKSSTARWHISVLDTKHCRRANKQEE